MTTYFADTVFWIALIDARDQHHARAQEVAATIQGKIVTTYPVLLETANALAEVKWRGRAIAFINHLRARSDVEIVAIDPARWDKGWGLFCSRPDKAWSMTDCLSFNVMQERGINLALTADEHFQQAGFRALLREPLL